MGDARSRSLRALEILMAVVGAVLSAVVFGVLTTALVGSVGESREIAAADLPALRVATLVDSTAQAWLEELMRARRRRWRRARCRPMTGGWSGSRGPPPVTVKPGLRAAGVGGPGSPAA